MRAQDLVASGQLKAAARLLVTGHSLGGALAVLAAFDIKLAISSLRVEVYTYGTPYPGNRAFAREFDELLPEAWHVIHDGVRMYCALRLSGSGRERQLWPGLRMILSFSERQHCRGTCHWPFWCEHRLAGRHACICHQACWL